MNIRCSELVKELDYTSMNALEISGDHWQNFGFQSYVIKGLPDFDVTKDKIGQQYDIIIAEQVFEHLTYPYRAAKNVYEMLNEGGYFLVSTPFLIKVHECPIDCSRWTPLGMKYFLEEAGFKNENIFTE
jgi:2-polyprenyl-3-methyl-5-hydroxy-6-metoxy-1,4-benzoquinol methylase